MIQSQSLFSYNRRDFMAIKRILVVTSDEEIQSTVSTTLVPLGYEVASVDDAAQGLLMAEAYHPKVMVVEPDLAPLDGIGMMRKLRSHPAGALVPGIFLAEKSVVEEKLQGFTLGADDFLPKPVNWSELESRVLTSLKKLEHTETTFRRSRRQSDSSLTELLAAFRGDLDELGIPSLLGLMESEKKTGTLVVTLQPEGLKVRFFLKQGCLMQARVDGKETPKNEELVYTLLGRSRGKFNFRPGPIKEEDEIKTPIAHLLLEGARRFDETSHKAE